MVQNETETNEKQHPAVAKIDYYVDENGNFVVKCPDLWIFRNSFFFAGVVGKSEVKLKTNAKRLTFSVQD